MLENTQYAVIKLLGFVKSFYTVPRFGHTKDISYFFSSDGTLRNDYFVGLIYVFSLIMGFAALWFLTLMILRILGSRVGCASGSSATIPAESMISKGSYSVHTDETGEFIVMQADQNRVNRTRIVYFLSGLYVIAGCFVLGYSFLLLMRSLSSFYDSAEGALNNVDSSKIDQLLTSAGEFLTLRDSLVTDLTGYCAGATTTVNGHNPEDVSSAFSTAISSIPDIANDASWTGLKTDITSLDTMIESMTNFLNHFDGPSTLWFLTATIATGVLFLSCVYLLACAWKSGKEGYQFVGERRSSFGSSFLHFFVTPLFILLLASSWFVTSSIFLSQTANADFCYDEIVTGNAALKIVVESGYPNTSDVYFLLDEYLHGCADNTATPITVVNAFEALIDDASTVASNFQEMTPNGDITALQAVCGGSTSNVVTKSNTVIEKLTVMATAFESIQSGMSCGTMAPLLQNALYENGCNSLSKALLWTFISGLFVSVFGTIMLTLRSATKRPQIYIVTPNPALRVDSDDSFGYGGR